MTTNLITQNQDTGLIGPEALANLKEQAGIFFKSGLAPKKFENPEQILVAMFYGRELGISPQRSLKEIHVIDGMPSISASLMMSLIRQRLPTAAVEIQRADAQVCEIRCRRTPDAEWNLVRYTIDEARLAGLLNKHNWKNHPVDMLMARCTTRMARWYFSDVVAGMVYTPEEIEEGQIDRTGAPMAGIDPNTMPVSGAAGKAMPKAGPKKAEPEQTTITDVEEVLPVTESILKPNETAELKLDGETIATAISEDDRNALLDFKTALDDTDEPNELERRYHAFREAYAGREAVLSEAYGLYNLRISTTIGQ